MFIITILCLLLLYFDLVLILEYFFFRARFTSFHTTPRLLLSWSVSLSYFIHAVPIHECFEKHLCMSSTFPIALLNGT